MVETGWRRGETAAPSRGRTSVFFLKAVEARKLGTPARRRLRFGLSRATVAPLARRAPRLPASNSNP